MRFHTSPPPTNFRPAPDRWTVAEVVQHLVISEPNYWKLLNDALNQPPKKLDSQATDADVLWYGIDRTRHDKTPANQNPIDQKIDLAQALKTFLAMHAQLLDHGSIHQPGPSRPRRARMGRRRLPMPARDLDPRAASHSSDPRDQGRSRDFRRSEASDCLRPNSAAIQLELDARLPMNYDNYIISKLEESRNESEIPLDPGRVICLVGAQILSRSRLDASAGWPDYDALSPGQASATGCLPAIPRFTSSPSIQPLKFGGTNAPDTYPPTRHSVPRPSWSTTERSGSCRSKSLPGPTANGKSSTCRLTSGPLAGNINANWNILMDYTLSAPVSFDAVAMQWAGERHALRPALKFGTICCAATSNPILPGPAFYNSGFNGLFRPASKPTGSRYSSIPTASPRAAASTRRPRTSSPLPCTLRSCRPRSPPSTWPLAPVLMAPSPPSVPVPGSKSSGPISPRVQTWDGSDFNGVNAPTKLGGTSVTVAGQPAFIYYFTPTQINLQVPAGVSPGSQSLVVTTLAGASAPFTVTVDAIKPALLAPDSFKIGGTQYVGGAVSRGAYVLPPDAIAGIASRRAKPWRHHYLYGIGFGTVTPVLPPGQIAQSPTRSRLRLLFSFGGAPATVKYDGLAPSYLGLQFNVVVPDSRRRCRAPDIQPERHRRHAEPVYCRRQLNPSLVVKFEL